METKQLIDCEFIPPSEVFKTLEAGDYVHCFNGTQGTVKSKDTQPWFIELEAGETFHILNVKSYYKN